MPSRRPALVLAVSLLALSAGACEDLIGIGDTIVIENETSSTITRVFIRDCSSSDWGVDRLGAEEVIAPNDSRGFDVGDGCYDLRADFLGGGQQEEHSVEIEDGDPFVWRIDFAGAAALAGSEDGALRRFLRRLTD